MHKSAEFSESRSERFELIRDWRDEIGAASARTLLMIGFNPSKAGAEEDDPTIRKEIGFARRWGFGRLVAGNLIATVSTDPWLLPHWRGIDLRNRATLQGWMGVADLVVAAWGSIPKPLARKVGLSEYLYFLFESAPVDFYCIGTTAKGDPMHPSRCAYTEAPKLWRRKAD